MFKLKYFLLPLFPTRIKLKESELKFYLYFIGNFLYNIILIKKEWTIIAKDEYKFMWSYLYSIRYSV